MSRNIKAMLVFTVFASVVAGGSSANAAQIRSVVQRHQHPEVGFYVNSHASRNQAITRSAVTYRTPYVSQFAVRSPAIYSAPRNVSRIVPTHHTSVGTPSSVKPVTYRSWHNSHSHS